MAADSHATRFRGVFELPVTSFRYHQSPPICFQHPNHLTHLHISTIPETNDTLPENELTACLVSGAEANLTPTVWLSLNPVMCLLLRRLGGLEAAIQDEIVNQFEHSGDDEGSARQSWKIDERRRKDGSRGCPGMCAMPVTPAADQLQFWAESSSRTILRTMSAVRGFSVRPR
jgi:hypothetical protein